jgi:hypothetical protein
MTLTAQSASASADASADAATDPTTDPATTATLNRPLRPSPDRPDRPGNPKAPVRPGRVMPATRPLFSSSSSSDESAQVVDLAEETADAADLVADAGEAEDRSPADRPVEFTVRPAQGLYGFVAGGSALLAVLFAVAAQAVGGGFGAGWRLAVAAAFAVLGLVAAWMLRSKPLLVADGTGIRLRVRSAWIGAPWEEIESVTVLPRRHVLDDGRIAVHLADPGPVVAAMDKRTRRITDANRRLTGSSLAVPFGLAATPSDPAVISALATLADDRCPVTEQP